MEEKITLGIFGGSFDPPHKGHVKLCEEFSKLISTKVLVMPTKVSPLKQKRKIYANDDERFEMCRLAFSHIPHVEICPYEILKSEISYTYITVKHFLELNPDEKIALCVGADCLESLEGWAQSEYLLKNCIIVAAYRYSDGYKSFDEAKTKLEIKYDAKIIPLLYSPEEISSSDIRSSIKNFQNYQLQVPEKVYEYILKKGLYGGTYNENKT